MATKMKNAQFYVNWMELIFQQHSWKWILKRDSIALGKSWLGSSLKTLIGMAKRVLAHFTYQMMTTCTFTQTHKLTNTYTRQNIQPIWPTHCSHLVGLVFRYLHKYFHWKNFTKQTSISISQIGMAILCVCVRAVSQIVWENNFLVRYICANDNTLYRKANRNIPKLQIHIAQIVCPYSADGKPNHHKTENWLTKVAMWKMNKQTERKKICEKCRVQTKSFNICPTQ